MRAAKKAVTPVFYYLFILFLRFVIGVVRNVFRPVFSYATCTTEGQKRFAHFLKHCRGVGACAVLNGAVFVYSDFRRRLLEIRVFGNEQKFPPVFLFFGD